jgi:SAM-dependent methyltransferase
VKSYQIKTEDYLDKLREVYVPAVNEPEPWRAVRWGSEELQSSRLEVMEELLLVSDLTEPYDWRFYSPYKSVLDVGCGRGELIRYIRASQGDGYLGIDIVPEMIESARNTWPNMKFEVRDLRDEPRPAEAVVASGTFTISNDEIFWSMLDAMWESAGKIMAFNCKSTWAPEDCASAGGISYLRDPAETLTECRKRYTRDLVLRHDYLDHDFTIAAYK